MGGGGEYGLTNRGLFTVAMELEIQNLKSRDNNRISCPGNQILMVLKRAVLVNVADGLRLDLLRVTLLLFLVRFLLLCVGCCVVVPKNNSLMVAVHVLSIFLSLAAGLTIISYSRWILSCKLTNAMCLMICAVVGLLRFSKYTVMPSRTIRVWPFPTIRLSDNLLYDMEVSVSKQKLSLR